MPTHRDLDKPKSLSAAWDRRRRERRKLVRRKNGPPIQDRLVVAGLSILLIILVLFGSVIADKLS